jgi:2-dehydropantoate 2-reductase
MNTLRILSIGAGAIGTYIGGSLALLGHKVVFVERPQVVKELQTRGLRISGVSVNKEPYTHQILPEKLSFFSSINAAVEHNEFDVALFALKSYDTPVFIAELSGSMDNFQKLPPFLCLSNGVANEAALAGLLGTDNVIAGTVTSAIGRIDAGDILVERLRGVGVGDTHPISELLTREINTAGLNAQLFPKAQDMKWSKMLTNLIANASSAILDMPPEEIFGNPKLYRLEIDQLRETLAVMHAQKINVVDLPGTPVQLLAFAVSKLPMTISRPFLKKAVGGGRGGKMPSFHIDLHSGRGMSEVNYLNGEVVRAGKETRIPTPVNQVLTNTLLRLTNGEMQIHQFARQPEEFLKLL